MRIIYNILLVILILCSYVLSADWYYYILDKKPADSFNSISLDSNDYPYILFYDHSIQYMTLAHWTGHKWKYEPVSSNSYYAGPLSLKIDKKNKIHISFLDWTYTPSAYLMYGYKSDDDWDISIVDDEIDFYGYDNDIAIDSKYYPHIVYRHGVNNYKTELRYAYFDGTKWNVEVVDNEYEKEGSFCSLALDSNDYPHITYLEDPNTGKYNLKYARWDGTKWIKEVLTTEDDWKIYTDIAIDSNDRPHITYKGYSYLYYKYSVFYIYFDGYSWKKELIDIVLNRGPLAIELDNNDYPCIAYKYFDGIKYAHWTGSEWIKEYACQKGAGIAQSYLSLALDSNDYPHITCDNYFTEPWSIWYIWYGEPLVGITLTSFSAKPNNDAITLNWTISTDEDISGFNLYRRIIAPFTVSTVRENSYSPTCSPAPVGEIAQSPPNPDNDYVWTKVNTSLITGTNPYSYTDRDITPNTNYEYKLEAVVSDKNETLGTTECTSENPSSFDITIYPNPSSGTFTLKYKGDISELSNIKIYDISGRLVKDIDIPQSDTESVNINDNTSVREILLDISDIKDGLYIIGVGDNVYKKLLLLR